RVIKDARRITDKPLLVRCDSAHDAVETRVSLTKHKDVSWIIKWNPRRANTSVLEHLAFDQGKVKELRPGKQVAVARYVERETYKGKEYAFRKVIRASRHISTGRRHIMRFGCNCLNYLAFCLAYEKIAVT
ncbi:MAG: hypothetical protein K6360_06200, partial [Deltaproteobacteria bacterium]